LPPPEHADQRQAIGWLVALTTIWVAAVALTTPWDWLPGGSLSRIDPTAGQTPDQLAGRCAKTNRRETKPRE